MILRTFFIILFIYITYILADNSTDVKTFAAEGGSVNIHINDAPNKSKIVARKGASLPLNDTLVLKENSTSTSTTTTTPKPKKPLITYSLDEEQDNSNLSLKQNNNNNATQNNTNQKYTDNQKSTTSGLSIAIAIESRGHPDYIVPVVITIFAVPLFVICSVFLVRKARDFWEKRHYRRMDFLIDGMYND
uniref:Putative mucin-5ac n=1 Tax=Xenopsylla cheopis TaxID=163159 RepID=A0A6M2DZ43_XENCH